MQNKQARIVRTHSALEYKAVGPSGGKQAYLACSFDNCIRVETSDVHALEGRKHDVHKISIAPILARVYVVPFVLL